MTPRPLQYPVSTAFGEVLLQLVDVPSNSPDDQNRPSGEETASHIVREETVIASGRTRFQHGRFEPGQKMGSRYRIVGLLGRGGMGEVYRADDLELGQSVALKFLPEHWATDPSRLRRFRNEVRTARQITHRNVCRIYDIGEEDGHVFLSMEYIDGEDLSGVLRRLGRPSREKAIEIARQICIGLAAAHENKVLHRDLKPANIMIDGRGSVRITDFGLAGFLDEFEGTKAQAGTPAYMAPEQLADGEVSVRSDIYSLGLILHELFTGKCVFDTDDIEELKRRHSSGSVTRPSSSTTELLDPVVERVIMRCLEPEPASRPQSVYQVLAALPGSDPLAAALAAGETPSPELVANARDAGGLRPPIALALVAVCLVSIAVAYLVSSATTVMPAQAPARLSVVAEQVMERLGVHELPPLTVSGYDTNMALNRSLAESPQSLDQLRDSAWPPKYRYWRRWTTIGFLPTDSHYPEDYTIDGLTHSPNETVTVALDSRGRLIELEIPPDLIPAEPSETREVDWAPLFEAAGLDLAAAEQTTPEVDAPIYCDTLTAWTVTPVPGSQTVVQMGAIRGRPNYFEYVDLQGAMEPNHADWRGGTVDITSGAYAALDVLLVILAIRNIRAGRADYRNALRCALFVGGLYFLMEVTAISVGGLDPLESLNGLTSGRAMGHFLQHGVNGLVYYLAIEPYVRRIWPRMLIGLLRLVSGRWRDPAVGREMLIGLAAGSALSTLVIVIPAVESVLFGAAPAHLALPTPIRVIISPGHQLSTIAHLFAWAVLAGMCSAGIVVLMRVLLRHPIVSICIAAAVLAALEHIQYEWSIDWSTVGLVVFALGVGACLVWLYTRVGVLAAMLFYLVVLGLPYLTAAFGAWATPPLVAWLAVLLALTGYSFWVSLAGQPIFKDMLAEPQTS